MKTKTRPIWQALGISVVSVSVMLPLCAAQHPGSAEPGQAGSTLKQRWFFSFGYGRNPTDVVKIKSLIDTGAAHGLNGMVLSSFGLDSIARWNDRDIDLLKQVQAHCVQQGIELIPTGFSVGYGGGALGHERNFAAALPTVIKLHARGKKLIPVIGRNLLKNGDLEQHTNGRFAGFAFHDQPGQISFPDTGAAIGKSCIRFTNLATNAHGHGRIMQSVSIQPGRPYRLSFRIKTQNLEPVSGIKAMILKDTGSLASLNPRMKSTQGWTHVSLEFINHRETEVKVYIGIWGGKSGTFWLDDLRLCQGSTLSDIVQRAGAPLSLRSLDRDRRFVQGRDFKAIGNLRELNHVSQTADSSIRAGETLELACYKIPSVSHAWGKQISLCMSNLDLYAYWEAQARKLHQIIGYKKILLSMDEIRNGGGCELCQSSGLSMAEILGNCITRQRNIFKRIDPEIEVLIWSDMLDPEHNARDNYYGVVGDFTGSWQHVPQDLAIMCWYHTIRDKSLAFFSQQGFRTFGASYYDADDLTNPRQWLTSLQKTPQAQGIMYTTWLKKYALLADFGDLVSGK
jgi:hypothetical protein